MEVRASQAVLHGAERSGGQTAGGVSSRDLHADDGHGTVDIPLRRAQVAQGVSRDRLHSAHTGWSGLPPQQQ